MAETMKANAKIRILVVDDDHTMRELLKSLLRREGYNVVGDAGDGDAALAQCENLDPHVVCLDINMPKLGGLQTLEAIKERFRDIQVVMVTGAATADVVRDAIDKGACGFIVKPFTAAKILDALRKCASAGAS